MLKTKLNPAKNSSMLIKYHMPILPLSVYVTPALFVDNLQAITQVIMRTEVYWQC